MDVIPADKKLLPTSMSAVAVGYCNRLFGLEEQFAALTPDERQPKRPKLAKPILDEFFAWLDSFRAVSGAKLSSAKAYALREKKYLIAYLWDSHIPISNNRALLLSIVYSEHPKEPKGNSLKNTAYASCHASVGWGVLRSGCSVSAGISLMFFTLLFDAHPFIDNAINTTSISITSFFIAMTIPFVQRKA